MTPEPAWIFAVSLAPCKVEAQFGQLPSPRAARTVVGGLIGPFSLAFVPPVNPSPAEIGERDKVRIIRKPLGLEASHLAGRGCLLHCSTTANDPAHRRIAPEPVGVVHVLVSGKATEHRLPQHS